MGMPLFTNSVLSFEEYLAAEQESETKHEFIDGVMYAMAGASRNHNLISANLLAALHSHVRGTPCATFSADMLLKLSINDADIAYYPDLMVVCDPEDNNNRYSKNPTVVIEILSKSTQRVDLREKFLAYQTIDSVQEYVVIRQDMMDIAVHQRSNNWQAEHYRQGDRLVIPSIKLELAVDEVYERVVFDESAPS